MNGEPVDCRAAAARVHALLDGELTEDSADELRRHLVACEHCLEAADVIEAIKRLVHRSCSGQVAPQQLRTRIVAQISYTRIERWR
ncbi:MAG: mycothiol system anti-sigma-R factor [Propioniciclava sp.]